MITTGYTYFFLTGMVDKYEQLVAATHPTDRDKLIFRQQQLDFYQMKLKEWKQ